MPPPSLRTICIEKTASLLEWGMWRNCENNPFSFLPPSVVEDLLSCMLSVGPECIKFSIVHSRLLLTSGRLRSFDLFHFDNLNERYLDQLYHMLIRGCRNLRTLSLLGCSAPFHVRILPVLLQNCTKLEQLITSVCFDPYQLRNSKKLISLKLDLDYEEAMQFFAYISPDCLELLAPLQVLAFSECILPKTAEDKEILISTTVKILDMCLNLSSVGFLDSMKAINRIHCRDGRTLKTVRHFKLRRCSWEIDYADTPKEYCDSIRVAALSCPLLQFLDLPLRYAGCLKHVMVLRNLHSLDMNFETCEDDYEQEFFALLKKIGPRLRTLCINEHHVQNHQGRKTISVDRICAVCPNLRTLELCCDITISEPIKNGEDLLNFTHLYITHCDRESLLFLLSNSVHLEKLSLTYGKDLDDALLGMILRKNSFAELETAFIFESSLSMSGLIRFVQIPLKLTHLKFSSSAFTGDSEVEQALLCANPSLLEVVWGEF